MINLKYAIYGSALCILIFICFNNIFLFENILSERDLSVFFYPNIRFWVESVRSGELPLWNPFIMCGEPFLANIQPNVLYPLSVIYLIFPVDFAFNLTIPLHFFLSGLFTFLLMKELRASDEAAAISAITFTFGGYLLSVHNVLSTLLSVTWFPAVIALYLRSLKRRSVKCALLCGIALYFMFSGGGLEIFIMTAAILLLLGVFPYLYRDREITLSPVHRLAYCFMAFTCFTLIGAVQIIPFMELLYHSIRSDGIAYREAVVWSLHPKQLLYLFAPDIFWKGPQYYWKDQSWLKTIYVGFLPILLGAFFCLEKGKRRLFVVSVIAGAFFLSLGGYNPIYRFLYEWIPVLQKIRYPVKFFFINIFFICLAAGWGWDYLQKHVHEKTTQRFLFFLFAFFGFFFSLLILALDRFPDTFWEVFRLDTFFSLSLFESAAILHNIKRVMFFAVIGSTLLFVSGSKTMVGRFTFYAFILVLLVDLFWGNYGHYKTVDRATFHKTTESQKVLKRDEDLYRIFVQRKIIKEAPMPYSDEEAQLMIAKNILCPNLLVEHKRFDAWGFSVLALKNYYRPITLIQSADLPDSTNLLNFMNIKYVLWSEELHRPGYELIRKDRFYLYKNTNYLKRAFLVNNYKVLHGEEAFRKTLMSPDFDPSATLLLKTEPAHVPFTIKNENPPADIVKITEYKNNGIMLDVTSSCPQFLVMSETFYPGWKAFVDGQEVPIYEADYAFRAVPVPRGRSTVVFTYGPLSFTIGSYISLSALVAVFIILMRSRCNKKEEQHRAE